MKKDTLTFERKLYTAPVCKMHVLQIEENIMSGDYNSDNHTEYLDNEEDGGLL